MATKYVLDTHALVWYLEGNPRLGADARRCLDAPEHRFVLPVIVLAEAAWLIEKSRIAIPSASLLMSLIASDQRIEVVDLTLSIVARSLSLQAIPEMHDRLIVATALSFLGRNETVVLLTKDQEIAKSAAIATLW